MKTTCEPMFSNGNEHLSWTTRNCDRCVKQSHYIEKTDSYTTFKCSIDRDINGQIIGLHEVNIKSFEATQQKDCPYIQTERKLPKRKKKQKSITT